MGPRSICQESGCFWLVSDPFLNCFSPLYVTTLCEHHEWALYVWALHVWALYVWALYVWPLFVSTQQHVWARCVGTLFFEHSRCDHSVCALYVSSMCALYVWALYVRALFVSFMCEQHVWARCVGTLCVSTMCGHSMCEHSMCDHSMCDHSVWALYVSSMCEHYLWAPWVSTLCVSTLCEHDHRKVGELPRKINIISWAGCCRTPKSTKISTKIRHQFLGRMLKNTEKHEN